MPKPKIVHLWWPFRSNTQASWLQLYTPLRHNLRYDLCLIEPSQIVHIWQTEPHVPTQTPEQSATKLISDVGHRSYLNTRVDNRRRPRGFAFRWGTYPLYPSTRWIRIFHLLPHSLPLAEACIWIAYPLNYIFVLDKACTRFKMDCL